MFERYTESARRVVFFARYEASAFGSPFIETEHLLLGFLREEQNSEPHPLKTELGTVQMRDRIESRMTRAASSSTSIDLPVSEGSKHVLSFAAEEAHNLGSSSIGMEHLLLGLLREENSVAGQILREQGLAADTQRKRLRPPPAA